MYNAIHCNLLNDFRKTISFEEFFVSYQQDNSVSKFQLNSIDEVLFDIKKRSLLNILEKCWSSISDLEIPDSLFIKRQFPNIKVNLKTISKLPYLKSLDLFLGDIDVSSLIHDQIQNISIVIGGREFGITTTRSLNLSDLFICKNLVQIKLHTPSYRRSVLECNNINESIKSLDLSVRSKDLSSLSNIVNIQYLSFYDHNIQFDIFNEHKSNFISLFLYQDGNCTNLKSISSCVNLRAMHLSGFKNVSSLEGLSNCSKLEYLVLDGFNKLNSFRELEKLENLKYVHIFHHGNINLEEYIKLGEMENLISFGGRRKAKNKDITSLSNLSNSKYNPQRFIFSISAEYPHGQINTDLTSMYDPQIF